MGACVVGAGPSGMYVAKYLAAHDVPVSIYEKSGRILGNYNYARIRGQEINSILDHKNIDLHLNTDASQIDDRGCDFYVVASGGVSKTLDILGGDLSIPGMHIVERHYDGRAPNIGEKVCIIGMGNVAFDIIDYVHKYCRSISIFSNRGFADAPFDNHILREAIDCNKWNIALQNVQNHPGPQVVESRRAASRGKLLKKIVGNRWSAFKNYVFGTKPTLNLRFGAKVEELRRKGQKIEVVFSSKNGQFRETFDSVISSIGFVPNKPPIKTEKPVFYTGWCVNAHGNVDDARQGARAITDAILEELYDKRV